MTNNVKEHSGYVALIGRPNVGKSTLLNQLLGKKISIVSAKPQTTRHRILGIKTDGAYQVIYVDTPGIHETKKKAMNQNMNRIARRVAAEVDVILLMIDASAGWTAEDDLVLEALKTAQHPIILIVNKIDRLSQGVQLLPLLDIVSKKYNWTDVIPISAKEGTQLDVLERVIQRLLPEAPHMFEDTRITDRDDKFIIAEIIREKLIYETRQEIPYDTTVIIDRLEKVEGVLQIDATIWASRKGQKAIIIGQGGEKLKTIGQRARLELEKRYGCHIFLSLWVKIKEKWTENSERLRELGII